ncbi:MAG: sugar ABC transporter substrate-binding protein [Actinomycetota bacterium]
MKKSRYLLAPLAALAVFAAACSDSKTTSETSAKPAETTAAPETSTAATDPVTSDSVDVTEGEDVTLAIITHCDGGVFWSVAQKGAEQAGADLGITVQYQGANNDGAAQAKMIDDAVAAGVDGIAVSLADPGALEASVKAAVAAGIPVITMNSGSDLFKELGAITHVGQDETVAGNGAGEKFKAAGKKKLLCVMQEQSNVGLEARCNGAEETFGGEVVKLTTSGDADPTTSQSEIKAALDADADIDAIFATGPIGAVLARDAVKELGRDVVIGAVDLSTDLLDAIEAGEIAFTIDQQQYLQGYLSVVFLYLNSTNKNTVGGGLPVYTGPGFVTADNVSAVKELVAKGTR